MEYNSCMEKNGVQIVKKEQQNKVKWSILQHKIIEQSRMELKKNKSTIQQNKEYIRVEQSIKEKNREE